MRRAELIEGQTGISWPFEQGKERIPACLRRGEHGKAPSAESFALSHPPETEWRRVHRVREARAITVWASLGKSAKRNGLWASYPAVTWPMMRSCTRSVRMRARQKRHEDEQNLAATEGCLCDGKKQRSAMIAAVGTKQTPLDLHTVPFMWPGTESLRPDQLNLVCFFGCFARGRRFGRDANGGIELQNQGHFLPIALGSFSIVRWSVERLQLDRAPDLDRSREGGCFRHEDRTRVPSRWRRGKGPEQDEPCKAV